MKVSVFLILIIFSGCAFHSGMMNSNPDYIKPGYELKKTVTAQANSTRVLGIGGLDKSGLVLEAKNKLYQYYPLRPGEAYANVSVDFRNLFVLVYHGTKATISADIIGPINDPTDTVYQSLFEQALENKAKTGIFEIGDEVYRLNDQVPVKYTILEILSDKKLLLGRPSNKNGKIKAKYKDLYLLKNKGLNTSYAIGDSVLAYVFMKWREANVIGLNQYKAIVEVTEDIQGSRYHEVPYGNIKSREE